MAACTMWEAEGGVKVEVEQKGEREGVKVRESVQEGRKCGKRCEMCVGVEKKYTVYNSQ